MTATETGLYPLTLAQERVFRAQISRPESAEFTITEAVEIFGNLDVAVLKAALRRLAVESDAFWVRFEGDQSEVTQRICRTDAENVVIIDLQNACDPKRIASSYIDDDAGISTRLTGRALLQVTLFILARDRVILCCKQNSIVSHQHGRFMVARRLSNLYSNLMGHRVCDAGSFEYIAALQHELKYERSAQHALDRAFWVETLAGVRLDRGPKWEAVAHERFSTWRFSPSRKVMGFLQRIAAYDPRAVPFLILAVAQDFCVEVLDRPCGFCLFDIPAQMDMLPDRLGFRPGAIAVRHPVAMSDDHAPSAAAEQRLREAASRIKSAFSHSGYASACFADHDPIELLPYDRSVPKITLTSMDDAIAFAGCKSEVLSIGHDRDLRLTLQCDFRAGTWHMVLDIRIDLLPDGGSTVLDGRASAFFEALIADYSRPPDPQREQPAQPVRPNHDIAECDWARDPSANLVTLFEAQASRVPNRTAVRRGGENFSYRRLNGGANAIASRLLSSGIQRGHVVAVTGVREPSFLAAILGVLKAGAAYLVVEPDGLSEFERRVTSEIGPKAALLFSAVEAGRWASSCPVHLYSGALEECIEDMKDPGIDLLPTDAAYVVATSGTTGQPKFVAATHRGICSYLQFAVDTFGWGPNDVSMCVGSLVHDPAAREIFGPLVTGSCVVLPTSADLRCWHRDIGRFDVNRLASVTPTLLRELLLGPSNAERHHSLKQILTCGEALDGGLVNKVRKVYPEIEIINQYGVSEYSMAATWYRCGASEPDDAMVPIGQPVRNTRVEILDDDLMPVEAGATGELYIAGTGLTAGYIGQATLTAECFRKVVLGEQETIAYRTGDRARLGTDGNIVIVGRRDEQVKVRGFRVEIAGVRAAILGCNGVRDAAVIARECSSDGAELHAFVVVDADEDWDQRGLRHRLGLVLPRFAIPRWFSRVEMIPRTRNNKLDQSALAALAFGNETETASDVRPGAQAADLSVEAVTMDALRSVLNLRDVTKSDSFFDLGGNSILAVRFAGSLSSRLGVEIPLHIVVQPKTIADMLMQIHDFVGRASAAARDIVVVVL